MEWRKIWAIKLRSGAIASYFFNLRTYYVETIGSTGPYLSLIKSPMIWAVISWSEASGSKYFKLESCSIEPIESTGAS